MTGDSLVDWSVAGPVLRVPAIDRQSVPFWAGKLAALDDGRRADDQSALAYRAWRQRWWRADDLPGRGRRLYHYPRAASVMANRDAYLELAIMPLGAARGAQGRGKFWESAPAREGDWLVTLPVFEWSRGALLAVDIIGWRNGRPDRWWSRTGAVRVLGASAAEAALVQDAAVRLYSTPQRWNRAGAGGAPGCCVLDFEDPLARELLAFAPTLIADDEHEALKIKRRVDRRQPRVSYIQRAAP
jgi:hypothetical protein